MGSTGHVKIQLFLEALLCYFKESYSIVSIFFGTKASRLWYTTQRQLYSNFLVRWLEAWWQHN